MYCDWIQTFKLVLICVKLFQSHRCDTLSENYDLLQSNVPVSAIPQCYFVNDVVLVVIILYLYKNGPQNVLYSIFIHFVFGVGSVVELLINILFQ